MKNLTVVTKVNNTYPNNTTEVLKHKCEETWVFLSGENSGCYVSLNTNQIIGVQGSDYYDFIADRNANAKEAKEAILIYEENYGAGAYQKMITEKRLTGFSSSFDKSFFDTSEYENC